MGDSVKLSSNLAARLVVMLLHLLELEAEGVEMGTCIH